jgi:N-acetylglutamate synthase-like GNAT family acetyltransferase
MNVRRYKTGEEKEIWLLYYNTTRRINGRDYTKEQVERWAPDQMEASWKERVRQKNPFVAEHEGEIVGFVELEASGHIDRFYCHHQWQRRGIGKLLYQAVEQEAFRLNINVLFLESSKTARKFFLSMGFEIVREESNLICGAPAPRFHMRKELKCTAMDMNSD